MNSNDQKFRELSKSELLEFLYFPAFFALFFLLQYYVIEVMPESKFANRIESLGGVALFGLLHVRSFPPGSADSGVSRVRQAVSSPGIGPLALKIKD